MFYLLIRAIGLFLTQGIPSLRYHGYGDKTGKPKKGGSKMLTRPMISVKDYS